MRAGRLAAVVAAALMTGACSVQGGVAGISSLPPPPPPGGNGITTDASARPFVTSPSTGPHTTPAATPTGDDPVRVPPPQLSSYDYVFPLKGCKVSYARKKLVLPKTTIWAGRGCEFVAPIDGTVHQVDVQNRWTPSTDRGPDRVGRFVSIIGKDGVRYLGGHLDSVANGLRPGVKVKAGQMLGRVGNTGDARDTATNLYFAVSWETPAGYWWIRRGMVTPWKYLDAWRDGNRTYSPRKETLTLRNRLGETPQCSTLCSGKPTPTPTKEPEKKKSTTNDDGYKPPVFVENEHVNG
ncbi:MAG TPA: M23 family metallopeptidase [Thermopolyspora sp.]